jgi:hypothetical protein
MAIYPYLAYLNLNSAGEELYNSIVDGFYSYSIKVTQNLSLNHGNVISDTVARLSQEGNENLPSYVYKLWIGGHKDLVKTCLPKTYEAIFNEDDVVLISKKFKMALKLSVNKDSDGDREVWGDVEDKTSAKVAWQLLPVWTNNRVSFKLKNQDKMMFLKMGLWPDSINDRDVFGSETNEELKHLWNLVPLTVDNKYYFHIVNRQFGLGLKLAETTGALGDRKLWGHNGDLNFEPARFTWSIKQFSTEYKDDV